MRTKNKSLRHPKSFKPNSPQIPRKSWTERHAPFASIIAAYSTLAAVIVAGLGYYFTVIPLYQKAAVDELIAKREFELKEVQAEIVAAKREAYEQRRANLITALERSVDKCADIFGGISSASLDPAVIRTQREKRIRLDVVVEPCLASVLTQYNASVVLTKIDYQHIVKIFRDTGLKLDRMRAEASNRIEVLPNLAATDPSVLAPVGEYVKKSYEAINEWQGKLSELNSKFGIQAPISQGRTQERFQYQIGITQERIANEYRMNALKSIRSTVGGIEWSSDVEADKASDLIYSKPGHNQPMRSWCRGL